jgi:hypothetical protein
VLTLIASGHPAGDAPVQLSPTAAAILYRQPPSLLLRVASDGANGVNAEWEQGKGPGMFIEEQRHGEEAILAGVLARRPELWRAGLREFRWAFAHQGRDGGFPATQDPFHSTSFLVDAVAHLTLVLEHSPVTLPGGLLKQVLSFRPGLLRAAHWLAAEPELRAGLASDAPYTHRRFLVGAALGLAGLLAGDRRLEETSQRVLELGLAAQLPSGEDPELGGPDDSYQARGLLYAEQYLSWLPKEPLAGRLRLAIVRGLRWESSRIEPSGFVPSAGNTRANGLTVDHNGFKRVVYPAVAQALLMWGLQTGEQDLIGMATRVAAWGRRHPAEVGS